MITLMKLQNRLIKRSERGVVSAEYAAVMAGGISIAGILLKLLKDIVLPKLVDAIGGWVSNHLPFF